MARLALSSGQVNNILWEINFDSFYGDVARVRDEYGDFPFHMYDQSVLTDYKYLFSYYPLKEAFHIFSENWKGSKVNRDFSTVYKFGNNRQPLSTEEAAQKLQKKNPSPAKMDPGHSYENMLAHFEQNILPLMKAHQDVQFTLYYPPFSVMYWFEVRERNPEIFQARMKLKEEIFRQVASLSNVHVYDFQAEEQMTYVLNNYMDTSHYFADINGAMVDYMSKGKPVTSLMEAQDLIGKLEKQVNTVNANQLVKRASSRCSF